MVADEVSALLDVVAHQDAEESVCFAGVVDLDVQQGPRGRVHRRFPELLGVHFTETFEAFYLDAFSADLSYTGSRCRRARRLRIYLRR